MAVAVYFFAIPVHAEQFYEFIQAEQSSQKIQKKGNDSKNNSLESERSPKEWNERQQLVQKEIKYYEKKYQDLLARFKSLKRQILLQSESLSLNHPSNLEQLQKQMLKTSAQLVRCNEQLQELREKSCTNTLNISNGKRQINAIHKILNKLEREQKQQYQPDEDLQNKNDLLQAKIKYYKTQLVNLTQQELFYQTELDLITIETEYLHKKHHHLDKQQLSDQEILSKVGGLADHYEALTKYLQRNRELSVKLGLREQTLKEIFVSQIEITHKIDIVKQKINEITRQAQWPVNSPELCKVLRAKVLELVKKPSLTEINNKIAYANDERMQYENQLNNKEKLLIPQEQIDSNILNTHLNYEQFLQKEVARNQQLLLLLFNNSEETIIALSQLRNAMTQLMDMQRQLQKAADRYLFWVADVNGVNLTFPVTVVKDLHKLISLKVWPLRLLNHDVFSGQNIIILVGSSLVALLSFSLRGKYQNFLLQTASKVGNVTQDSFSITAMTVLWSLLISLTIPIFITAAGYCLKNYTDALSKAILNTVPLIGVLSIYACFSYPNCGLFIKHFNWKSQHVVSIRRLYPLAICLLVPLLMVTITFNYLEEHQFAATLGRVSFMLLCLLLSILTVAIKRTGVSFYIKHQGSNGDIVDLVLWYILISAPILAILCSTFGYLAVSQELLLRIEGSVVIWCFLLFIYHLIWRWMLIQRRRIAFERAKQRRADKLAQRARFEEELIRTENNLEMQQLLDLDTISTRSLQLLRSVTAMAALVALIWWWSKMHPAFVFLENIHLWSVEHITQGSTTVYSVTLGRGLLLILLLVITTQVVRNLPALLELSLLQHLNLSPGTSYAITTLSKYLLTLIGILVGISLLGIDWPKIQWVATALGVGLGFGLKDIFANFISGLILLFEQPIRIGDTVTIREHTGTVTKINTRATVISNWDRKELVIPNHALITEHFLNWSLSDAITRIVLKVTAPIEVNSQLIIKLIQKAAKGCALVLHNPSVEVYLNELDRGIQDFEVRLYVSEVGHRMRLRHEFHQRLLMLYRRHGILLPYPPTQIRVDEISKHTTGMSKR